MKQTQAIKCPMCTFHCVTSDQLQSDCLTLLPHEYPWDWITRDMTMAIIIGKCYFACDFDSSNCLVSSQFPHQTDGNDQWGGGSGRMCWFINMQWNNWAIYDVGHLFTDKAFVSTMLMHLSSFTQP